MVVRARCNALLTDDQNQTVQQVEMNGGKVQTISGSFQATLDDIQIFNEQGIPSDIIFVGEYILLKIRVRVNEHIEKLVFGYMLKDRLGLPIFGTTSEDNSVKLLEIPSTSTIDFQVRFCANLGPGTYSISTALAKGKTHLSGNLEWRDRAAIFTVVNRMKSDFVGVVWLESTMTAVISS